MGIGGLRVRDIGQRGIFEIEDEPLAGVCKARGNGQIRLINQ
jgi:hypothetical protein